jgi:hypothetical protein
MAQPVSAKRPDEAARGELRADWKWAVAVDECDGGISPTDLNGQTTGVLTRHLFLTCSERRSHIEAGTREC